MIYVDYDIRYMIYSIPIAFAAIINNCDDISAGNGYAISTLKSNNNGNGAFNHQPTTKHMK